jgi:hypothetical protein
VLFELAHLPCTHLLHQPVDDLDAGQIALVDGAIEALPGESLLVQRAAGIAVEEAADLVLELADALHRARAEPPGQVLTRQPLAADGRIHEVALDAVGFRQRHVVAALHHAGAARLAERALGRDGDVELGVGQGRVQRREQSGPAGTEDQDVPCRCARQPSPGAQDEQRARDERDAEAGMDQPKPLAPPGQEFDREHAQAEQQMNGQENHEATLRRHGERQIGEAQEIVERPRTVEREPER